MNETKNILTDIEKLSLKEKIILLWIVRFFWIRSKVKKFGRKFFPLDPMFYQGKKAA